MTGRSTKNRLSVIISRLWLLSKILQIYRINSRLDGFETEGGGEIKLIKGWQKRWHTFRPLVIADKNYGNQLVNK